MFGNICACLAVLVNMGKYNSLSIVDIIICPLVHFALIILIVGCTLFRWEDTAMKFPVHPESLTAELPLFLCVFFVWHSSEIATYTCIFNFIVFSTITMFLIISPTSIFSFLPYACLVVL